MICGNGLNLLGCFALVPLMLSMPAGAAARVLHLPFCGGDRVARMVEVPVGGETPEKERSMLPKRLPCRLLPQARKGGN